MSPTNIWIVHFILTWKVEYEERSHLSLCHNKYNKEEYETKIFSVLCNAPDRISVFLRIVPLLNPSKD